jgi:threo-3-hydroxy-L-aspartate ammonia-lyase
MCRAPSPPRKVRRLSIDLDDIRRAARVLDGVAHRTPVVTSRTLDERTGARVALKAESLQRAGAFKFRGAYNAVSSLTAEERAAGVVTASSGNHAQALALAARLQGVQATVLMPEDAPASKRAATDGYGAHVVAFDRYADDREELLARLAELRGLHVVHPYDDLRVMAGQGTVALELLEDADPLDLLLVPVGGGGLISGCATAAKALADGIEVVGVEPEAGDDVARSKRAGAPQRITVAPTIADGQQTPAPGLLTWPVIDALVDNVVTVSDAEILDAMRFLLERMRLVVEPSGASALAALLAGRVEARGRRVGVILSGGNVDLARLYELFSE